MLYLAKPATRRNAPGIVFTSYLATGAIAAAVLWMIFNIADGLVLLSPDLTFYWPVPENAFLGFVLSIITSILGGVVISSNIFLFNADMKIDKASFLSGSALGTISSMCASCSSIGFYLASTLGVARVATSSFLSTYQTPMRLAAIAILVNSLTAVLRRIGIACRRST